MRRRFLALGLIASLVCGISAGPRTVIIVQEGLGHQLLEATRLYSNQPELWDWRLDSDWEFLSLATLPATTSNEPEEEPTPPLSYDAFEAWNGQTKENPSIAPSNKIAGYDWLIANATDPLQASTSLLTGISTYNGSINWKNIDDKNLAPLTSGRQLFELFKSRGLKTGLISQMPINSPVHAVFSGQRTRELERKARRFRSILEYSPLDLYVAAGNPLFNEDGDSLNEPDFSWIDRSSWEDLRGIARETGWSLIFGDENLRGVSEMQNSVSARRLVLMNYGDTTKFNSARQGQLAEEIAFFNTLKFQVQKGLEFLNSDPDGFILMIHLGRIPHLLKDNYTGPAINEVIQSLRLITFIEDWMTENGDWRDSSVILASTFEYGLVWGSDSSNFPFAPLKDRGNQREPGMQINHSGPTASLTPLLVKGKVTTEIGAQSVSTDPVYGGFISKAKLYTVLSASVQND